MKPLHDRPSRLLLCCFLMVSAVAQAQAPAPAEPAAAPASPAAPAVPGAPVQDAAAGQGAATPAPPAAATPVNARRLTLAALGYPQGLQQTTSESAVVFYLPMPQDVPVLQPRLQLEYVASATMGRGASMQVLLNGSPRRAVMLAAGASPSEESGQTLTIPLQPADLERAYLEVRVLASFNTTPKECSRPGQEEGQHFLNILPATALAYELDGAAPASVRGFLTTLPQDVGIALSAPAAAEQMRASWMLAHQLLLAGHTLHYSRIGDGGDILVAPRAQLHAAGLAPPPDQALALVPAAAPAPGVRLAIAEPFQVDAIADPWQRLLSGPGYEPSTSTRSLPRGSATVPLAKLGVDGVARPFADAVEWNLGESPLLAGRAPSRLRLNLIVPPTPDAQPLVLYVFQSNALRGISTLPAAGGAQSVTVSLLEGDPVANGPIRIMLKRQIVRDACDSVVPNAFVQLLPSSVLETIPSQYAAESVAGFAAAIAGGYTVHLPVAALADPIAWVQVLADLSQSLGLDPRSATVRTVDQAPEQDKPFVWLGQEAPGGFDAALAFDRGRIQVKNSEGAVLLDTARLPGITTAGLLRDGSRRGLWLRALGSDVPRVPPGMKGSTGDVMFGDSRGVLVSLDTRQSEVARVDYPNYTHWTDRVMQHRGWIFGLAWIVLTLLVIALVRKLRRSTP